MGRIKRSEQIKCQRDAMKHGSRHGWSWRTGAGSHVVGKNPKYPGSLSVPGGELSRGVKRQIVKVFLSVGMPLLILGVLYLYYIGG